MSRCFPFPPPGYERKHILEDLHLLKEAKHKEKHKKEKKDKEKKRDKEKDKHAGDEKHRDKKERKEKHKDKKEKHRDRKDKEDRGKDKDKSSISEESTVSAKLEQSRGKLYSKGHSEDRISFSNEEKCPTLFQGQNGAKPAQSNHPSLTENSKFLLELDRRIRDDENSRGSQLPRKVPVVDQRNQEMVAGASVRNSLGVQKAENKNRRIDRKTNPQGFGNEDSRNKFVQNTPLISKIKDEGIPRPLDEQNGQRMGENERYKQAGDVKWSEKKKIGDNQGRVKDKEKKKEDTVKVKTENKKVEQGKLKDDGKNILGEFIGHTSTDLLKSSDNNFLSKGKIRKREDTDTNGFLHDSDIRPNKVQRPAPPHLSENGRKIDACRVPGKPSQDVHTATDSVRSDKKDQVMNGIIEAQKPLPSKPVLSAATVVTNQITEAPKVPRDSNSIKGHKVPKVEDLIAEALRRPPHPDTKYLTNVLTVPKLTDSLEDDEQDWLLRKKYPSRKPGTDPEKNSPRVWSEAVHIETANVFALPYVIPY